MATDAPPTELADATAIMEVAELARASGRFGIDTEFMGEGRYRTLVCLVQVAVEDESAPGGIRIELIDTLTDVDCSPLAALLADPAIEVILHAGRQDVALLRRVWRTEVTNIFDTQLAAGFVGFGTQAGYARLLNGALGIKVPDSASFTRWDRRPLTSEQLSYAADDVAHLIQLADELERRLEAAGRLEWAREECRALEGVSDERDPDDVWERLPKVTRLKPQARAVARELAAWREGVAAAEDRPVSGVVGDQQLVEIAKRTPRDMKQLEAIRGVHGGILRKRGNELLEAVARGLASEPVPMERTGSVPPDAGDEALIALAQALVRSHAVEADIAYELIASRDELARVVVASRHGHDEPDVRALRGWRRELVGGELLDLLGGRRALTVDPNGRLHVEHR
jgi:ribonuclease D